MTRCMLIGLVGLTLAACVSADELEARDRAQCISAGAEIGTTAYTDCRSALASQREAQERAQLRANMNGYRRQVGR